MTPLSRVRTTAIALATIFAATNALSAYLFHQLPDDPYHIAWTFATYSHFGSVLSILGLIGAINEHAFSVAIFATYLLIDTVVCSIPRFLALALLSGYTDAICSVDNGLVDSGPASLATESYRSDEVESTWTQPDWLEQECRQVIWVMHAVALLAAIGVVFIKFVCAMQLRGYSRRLFEREKRKRCQLQGDGEKDLEERWKSMIRRGDGKGGRQS